MKRLRIVVVMGEIYQFGFFDIFEKLGKRHDVTFCTLENQDYLEDMYPSLKIKYFKSIPDLPGYLRGLERELEEAHVLVSCEGCGHLESQSLQIGKKLSIATMLMARECSQVTNSVKALIKSLGKHFKLITDNPDLDSLKEALGIKKNQINFVFPAMNLKDDDVWKKDRQKFRRLLRIDQSDRLILVGNSRNDEFWNLKALNYLEQISQKFSNPQSIKMVFLRESVNHCDLQYQVADRKLSDNVRFVSKQFATRQGLFCASDVLILDEYVGDCEQFSMLLEAVSCKSTPVFCGGLLDFPFGDFGIRINFKKDGCERLLDLLEKGSSKRLEEAKHDLFNVDKYAEIVEQCIVSHHREVSGRVLEFCGDSLVKMIAGKPYSEAISVIEKNLELCFSRPLRKSSLLTLLGEIEVRAGNLEEGKKHFIESLHIDAQNWRSHLGLGWLLYQVHAHEDSLAYFKKTIAIEKNCSQALLGIGLIHRRLGIIEDAIFWLYRSFESNYDSEICLLALTQACLEAQFVETPIRYLEKVKDIIGEYSAVEMALGQLYMRNGDFKLGCKMVNKVLDTSLK